VTPESALLEVRLVRQIHDGLKLDISMWLGNQVGVLFGASGAGKTSILRMITGLDRPDAGYLRIGDRALFDSAKGLSEPLRLRQIGMIFQDDLLFPHLRVRDNIGFGLSGQARAQRKARVREVAVLCGVEDLLDRLPQTLSGGERQRVGLARSLAPRPQLLLCDEPVSALDLPNRQTLIERLRVVQRSEGIPVLYVTHSPAEAILLGARMFLLEEGRIKAEGPPLDVLSRLAAAPLLHLEGVRNSFPAHVEDHAPEHGITRLRLAGGPVLTVPSLEQPAGALVAVDVRADDILLATAPISGLSAQNLIEGTVDRVVVRGSEAEVVVRTGEVAWIVSIVAPAVAQLGLAAGMSIRMIIKARSCNVRTDALRGTGL
jgi:molybdate transport system ATP-binding protein